MRVLVSGSNGFVGQALIKELRSRDHYVTGLDLHENNLSTADEYVRGSVLDADRIPLGFGSFQCIVHLAALLGVEATDKRPEYTMSLIIDGTRNMIKKCEKEKSQPRFIYLSSSEVFGSPAFGVRLNEGMDVSPRTPYAAAKLCAEHYVMATIKHGCIVRPYNIYGAGQRDCFVAKAMMNAALAGKPIRVFGDGTQVRSFCYIDDFVAGLGLIVEGGADGMIVNIGRNEPIPMYLLAELIKKVTGSESKIELVPYERSDRLESREIGFRAPDISWAKTHLDWSPDVTLEEGLKRMVMEMKVGA